MRRSDSHAKDETEAEASAPHPLLALPFSLERAQLDELTLEIRNDDELDARVGPGRFVASDLARGRQARLAFTGPIVIAPEKSKLSHAGTLELESELRVERSGDRMAWNGAGAAYFDQAGGRSRPSSLEYHARFQGSLGSDGHRASEVHTTFSVDAELGGKPAGTIAGSVDSTVTNAWDLDATIELKAVTEAFLNPLLAPAMETELHSARFDATAQVETDAGQVRFTGTASGSNWRLLTEAGPTPPLAFRSNHAGTWNQGSRTLELRRAQASVEQDGRKLIGLALTQPLSLGLAGSPDSENLAAQHHQEPIRIDATIAEVTLDELRPWLHALGSPIPNLLERGGASAELHLQSTHGGRQVGINGRLDLHDLRWKDGRGFPDRLSTRLEASLEALRRFTVSRAHCTLTTAGEEWFRGGVSGFLDWGSDRSSQVSEFELALRAQHPGGVPPDDLTVRGAIERGEPLRISAQAQVRNLDATAYAKVVSVVRGRDDSTAANGVAAAQILPTLPFALDLSARIDRVTWNALALEDAWIEARTALDQTRVDVKRATVLGGTLQGTFDLSRSDTGRALGWAVRGIDLDAESMQPFLPETAADVQGRFAFSTQASGSAPIGVDLRDTLEGTIQLELTEADIRSSRLLNLIADWTRVASLRRGRFDRVEAELTLGGGVARIERMQASGPRGRLLFRGSIGLDGSVDVVVTPHATPALAKTVTRLRPVDWLLTTADGMRVLPIEVEITGQIADPQYKLRSRGQKTVEDMLRKGGGLASGTARGTTRTIGSGAKRLGGAVRGILGRTEEEPEPSDPDASD
jgi:hypothetical protein